MKVLDLFAGLGGWSEPFREHGHDVLTLDNDPAFGCDLTLDVMRFDPRSLPWRPDVILASPPCERFSTLAFQRGHFEMIGRKPNATYRARTPEGELALALVQRARWVVNVARPRFYVIENPRALLRQLLPASLERRTVWYCHVGHELDGRPVAKPTDLWGDFPPSLVLPPPCHNRRPEHPADCCCTDHVAAPRGSRTGTQGPESAAERAKVPRGLAELVRDACERDLG